MKFTCFSSLFLVASLLLAITESRSIHKRSDDPDPLVPVVDRLAAKVAQLEALMDTMNHKAAFSVQFSTSHPHTQANSPFKFDAVNFDLGNNYNRQLGVFTAPYPGIYTFSVQVFTYGRQRPLVDIQVNSRPVGRMAVDTTSSSDFNNGEDSISMTVIVKLTEGSQVWVESLDDATHWGYFHTFFNGALLYEA